MNLVQKCVLFSMVGFKSEIFAFIADNFTVEICCRTYGPPCTVYIPCAFLSQVKIVASRGQKGNFSAFFSKSEHHFGNPSLPQRLAEPKRVGIKKPTKLPTTIMSDLNLGHNR